MAAVLLPLSVGIALVAPEVGRLALGPAWAGAAPIIALCALYALADAMAHFTFSVFTVLDRQARLACIYAAMVAVRLPAIILAAHWAGLPGVAATLLATGLLNMLVWNWQAARLIALGFAAIRAQLWRSLAAGLAMALAVLGLRAALPAEAGQAAAVLWRLACLAACGAAVHVGAQWLLWRLAGRPADAAEARIAATAAHGLRRVHPRLAAAGAAAGGALACLARGAGRATRRGDGLVAGSPEPPQR